MKSDFTITAKDVVRILSSDPMRGKQYVRNLVGNLLADLASEDDAYRFADVNTALRESGERHPSTNQMVALSNLNNMRLGSEEPPKDGISRAPATENYK